MSFLKDNMGIIKVAFTEKDYSFIALTVSLFLMPLSINLSTFSLVASLVLKVFQILFFKQKIIKVKSLKVSSITGLFFFIFIIINSIIQNNIAYTISVFENEFSHLILLIFIPFLLRGNKENIILCYALFLGLIVACSYVFITTFFLNINFDRDAFERILDIHHTYLSMYILFFINFLLAHFFDGYNKNNLLNKAIYILTIAFGFLIIYILNSKVSIVVFAILLGGYLIVSFSKNNAFKYVIVFSILTTCIVVFNNKLNVSYKSALDFRQEIWTQSVNSIKQNIFFGNLKMPEKDILNYKHYLSGKYYLMDSDLNSHNQYLSILLKFGVIGFLILLLYPVNLVSTLNKSTTNKTMKEVVGFGIILLMIFYIENVLDRHHGIVFFSIFYNYYLVAIQNEDN
ncbi:O-antigen ligase family protein [Yeosuana sp. AK3]